MSILTVHEHPDATEHYETGPHYDCTCRVCVLKRKVEELENEIEGLNYEILEVGERNDPDF